MQEQDFKFPWGRWLVWGLLAVGVLAAIVIFFANRGDEIEASATTPPTLLPGGGEQVEWTIEVSEYGPSPGTVTLKGDTPLGFPTETWKDGVQIARTVDARAFEWNMDVDPEVPVPVYEIDQAADCDELQELLNTWVANTGSAAGDARRTEGQAFAQHAANTMLDQGCEIDLNS
jgi:hypothetical protein